MADSSRFPTINEEQFKELIKAKDAENTQRSTAVGVRIFQQYLSERGYDKNFETYDNVLLADVLEQFYVEARRENGDDYKTGSLINIRAAINRHLKNSGRTVNIINDTEFTQANIAFTAKQAELKRSGYGDTQSYPPLDENDIDKLYQSGLLDINTPRGLQRKVWFELMLFICRRGRENLRKLEKDHFAVAADSNGRKYVYQCKDEMTKRIRGDNMKSRVDAGRMYATEGEGCPVASFEKYVSKLNPKCNAFFQAPYPNMPSTDDGPWYKNAPVGEKCLGNMMSKMSTEAGLSRRYTNHSLRATCITLLDENGFQSRDICNVTGHRNERSIRTYIGRPNDRKRQKLSDALSTSIGYNPPKDQPSTSAQSTESESMSVEAKKADPRQSTSNQNPQKQTKKPMCDIGQPSTSTVCEPASPVPLAQPANSLEESPLLTNSQLQMLTESWDDDIDIGILADQRQSQITTSATSAGPDMSITSSQTQTRNIRVARQLHRHLQQQPLNFNNCTVTINYNLN